MNQGKVKVLELLQAGHISVDEAITLLEAMEPTSDETIKNDDQHNTSQTQSTTAKENNERQSKQTSLEESVYDVFREFSDTLRKGFNSTDQTQRQTEQSLEDILESLKKQFDSKR